MNTGTKVFLSLLVIAILSAIIIGCAGCTRIPPGHVGIVINYAGDNRGVSELPTTTGWTFYNPITQTVFEYPTFVQTAVWTRSPNEGKAVNEEISFNSKDGLNITGDISFSYQLAADHVPHFYVKFRSDNLETFTHTFLRNIARDGFVSEGGKYTAEEIYATKTEEFVTNVKRLINTEVNPYGVAIEQFGFIGAPRPPQQIIDAINGKVAATQNAMRVENEVRQAQGEASKKIAYATGEAKANQILAQSISPQLIQWRQLAILELQTAKWNGQVPMVQGQTNGMFLNMPVPQQK